MVVPVKTVRQFRGWLTDWIIVEFVNISLMIFRLTYP